MILKDFIKEKIYLLDDPKTVLNFFADSKAYLNPVSQVQLSTMLKKSNIQFDWDLAIKGSQFDSYKVLPNYETTAGLYKALKQLFQIKELQLVNFIDIGNGIVSIAKDYELIYAVEVLDSDLPANRIKITLENNTFYSDLVALWFKASFINSKTNEEAMNFIISVDELQRSFKEDIITLIPDYVVLYNQKNLDKAITKIKNVIIAIITEAQNQ